MWKAAGISSRACLGPQGLNPEVEQQMRDLLPFVGGLEHMLGNNNVDKHYCPSGRRVGSLASASRNGILGKYKHARDTAIHARRLLVQR